MTGKRLSGIFLLSLFLLLPVSAQEIYLTEAEYHSLMNLIRQSKANSERQTALAAELKETLKAQEAALLAALDAVGKSESELAELKNSLARIRGYSTGLSEYCKTLEADNAKLAKANSAWKKGCGITGGAAALLLILLCIL
jgi:BMFP domain-containing protein YqiC